MDYSQSGVDIDAGNEAVRRIRQLARGTFTSGVLSDIGSFGGLFSLDAAGVARPVLVASADGVGTKLKIAFLTGRHNTVGADLVNHCVNDILVQGARPLFFLDYLATGRLAPAIAAEIVSGISEACRANGCALLGGETAEMPGFYGDGEYDLAGFIVGVVERDRIVDGQTLRPGDVLVGLPSAGLHTNGYSLARRIVFDRLGLRVDAPFPGETASVGDVLLRPHRSYLHAVWPLLERRLVKGMAHITGGGLTDNLPRILPESTAAEIRRDTWDVPSVFRELQRAGEVAEPEMYRAFNMGIGLVIACGRENEGEVVDRLRGQGEAPRVIGEIVAGDRRVIYR